MKMISRRDVFNDMVVDRFILKITKLLSSPISPSHWIFAQIICAGTEGAVIRTKEVYVYPCY